MCLIRSGVGRLCCSQSVQQELNSIAVALRPLSSSDDAQTRRLAEAALGSLRRAARLLGLTVPRDSPPPSPPRDPTPRVCPERYINSTVGYPFFYDGWRAEPCPLRRGYGQLLTVLLTLTEAADVPRVRQVLRDLNERYPGVQALVGVTESLVDRLTSFRGVTAVRVTDTDPPPLGTLLNQLVSRVDTEYVLLAADLERLDSDSELERLLREAERQQVAAVAGAARRPDGHWTHGCFQVRLSNYSLQYHAGYHHSRHECLQCDHVAGPFIARTELLRRWPLAKRNTLLAERWLLDVRGGGGGGGSSRGPALVCPDVMFHVRRPRVDTGAAWLQEARRLRVTRVQPPEGRRLVFTCRQLRLECEVLPGRLLSPCCRLELLRLIHGVMEGCRKAGALCELQEGTLLGESRIRTYPRRVPPGPLHSTLFIHSPLTS